MPQCSQCFKKYRVRSFHFNSGICPNCNEDFLDFPSSAVKIFEILTGEYLGLFLVLNLTFNATALLNYFIIGQVSWLSLRCLFEKYVIKKSPELSRPARLIFLLSPFWGFLLYLAVFEFSQYSLRRVE